MCIPVPLYHCFGMVLGNLACTTHGAAMVYPSPTFDARATLQAVQSESCTSLYGTVPSNPVLRLYCKQFSRSPVPACMVPSLHSPVPRLYCKQYNRNAAPACMVPSPLILCFECTASSTAGVLYLHENCRPPHIMVPWLVCNRRNHSPVGLVRYCCTSSSLPHVHGKWPSLARAWRYSREMLCSKQVRTTLNLLVTFSPFSSSFFFFGCLLIPNAPIH